MENLTENVSTELKQIGTGDIWLSLATNWEPSTATAKSVQALHNLVLLDRR